MDESVEVVMAEDGLSVEISGGNKVLYDDIVESFRKDGFRMDKEEQEEEEDWLVYIAVMVRK